MPRILYEQGDHFVIATPKAYEVYRNGVTAAEKRATIGLSLGLSRAIAEVERREDEDKRFRPFAAGRKP